jgi:hypothetical protein
MRKVAAVYIDEDELTAAFLKNFSDQHSVWVVLTVKVALDIHGRPMMLSRITLFFTECN